MMATETKQPVRMKIQDNKSGIVIVEETEAMYIEIEERDYDNDKTMDVAIEDDKRQLQKD